MTQPVESMHTAADGAQIFWREWLAEHPKALVVLVHGLGEHCGRYHHVAKIFNQEGYSLFSFDLRGHGKTPGKRGHAPSYDTLVKDVEEVIASARSRFPNLPVFIYGHSMGGSIALYFGFTSKTPINGMIVTSPGLRTAQPVPPAKKLIANVFGVLMPSMTVDNGLYLPGLSRDTAVIDAYKADPLVHPMISAKLGLDLMRHGEWMIEHAGEFTIPLLLMQGTADQLVNPAATAEFASKVKSPITYMEFDGWYHELHNEPEKARPIKAIVDWIGSHLH